MNNVSLLLLLVPTLIFAQCYGGDIEATVTSHDLVASTDEGSILISEEVVVKSIDLTTKKGDIHAKFSLAGIKIQLDTESRTNIKFVVTLVGNVLKVSTRNFIGKYDAQLKPNQVLTTVGDITEYGQQQATGHFYGMCDFGKDLLKIDASGAAANIDVELTAAYDVEPCQDASCVQYELRATAFAVPAVKTTYVCYQWPIPAELQANHIVRIDPIVENAANVHHIVVFITSSAYTNGVNCPMGADVLYAWAVGIEPFKFPSVTGLGIKNTYITLSYHYDNAKLESGIIDSSGLKFYVAPPRPQPAAMLWLAADLSKGIPAKQNNYTIYGACVLDAKLPKLTLFAEFKHMHQIGKRLWTYRARSAALVANAPAGKQYVRLENLNGDENTPYDFNRQEFAMISPPLVVGPGDGFVTHCQYDSSTRTAPTVFGEDTANEMCFHFVMHYPAVAGFRTCNNLNGIGVFLLP